ncbi:MAG: hypothetical protein Q9228_002955 [Teloschistes exilis]
MSMSEMRWGSSSWLDGDDKSGPSEKELTNLHSTTVSPKTRSLGLKPEEAFTLVDQALEGHRRTVMVFHELDKEFFRSMLSGNVSLGWSDLPQGVFSRTIRAGPNKKSRIRIELSSQLYWHRSPQHILAALIHQMVHAYYLQCCGYRDPNSDGDGHDLCHERPFWALLQCIGEHLEPLRDILKEDLEVVSDKDHAKSRSCPCRSSSKESRPGSSRCYETKKHCSDEDIQDWRGLATATAKSLQEARDGKITDSVKQNGPFPRVVFYLDKDGREQAKALDLAKNPGDAHVFLRHEDRCFPVARSAVADLAALTASPCFEDKYYLSFPPDTTTADFQFFYLFLVHGVYPPSVRGPDRPQSFHDTADQGPPKIQPFGANSPANLRSLLVAYRLGLGLQYKPFSDHVQGGLWSLSASAEDPVALLDLIYRNYDFWNEKTGRRDASTPFTPIKVPDPKLREWVRAWLTVPLSYTDALASHGSSYMTNLSVLRHHTLWQDRYAFLKAQSSDLREDDREAEAQLRSRYATSSSSVLVGQDHAAKRLTPPAEEELEQAVLRGRSFQDWLQQQQPTVHHSHLHPSTPNPWYQPYRTQDLTFPDMACLQTSLPVPYAEDPHAIVNPEVWNAYARFLPPRWQQQQRIRNSNPDLTQGFTPAQIQEMLAGYGYMGFPRWE